MEKKIRPDWFSLPLVQRVIDVLGAGNIRFVGGAVRDTLLGRKVEDIDAACRHNPGTTMDLLTRAGLKVIPTGIDHGTVTAVLEERTIEITTLRRDSETDGRHATVSYTDDWSEDAARRDFTFNAMYLSSDGTLYDPYNGLADLKGGRVRFIGDADVRIEEDALRIMRFFRFHAWYGEGALDSVALEACRRQVWRLEALSAERIRTELLKIFSAHNPTVSIGSFVDIGGSSALKLPAVRQGRLQTYLSNETEHGVAIDPLLRLASWACPEPSDVTDFVRQFRFSNKDGKRLYNAAKGLEACRPESKHALRKLYYTLGRDAAQLSVMTRGEGADKSCFEVLQNWQVPIFPVMGRDLLAKGEVPGPEISRKLGELEALWIESDFQLSKKDLLSVL